MTEETWYGKQDYVDMAGISETWITQAKKGHYQGLPNDILLSLEDKAKTTIELYEVFPDSSESTIRGRLSDLKRNGEIERMRNGKWRIVK